MARPATTLSLCQEIHLLLLNSDVEPGKKIPRGLFDKLIVRAQQVGNKQAENVVKTGKMAGLWEVIVGHGPRPGYIILMPSQGLSEARISEITDAAAIGS